MEYVQYQISRCTTQRIAEVQKGVRNRYVARSTYPPLCVEFFLFRNPIKDDVMEHKQKKQTDHQIIEIDQQIQESKIGKRYEAKKPVKRKVELNEEMRQTNTNFIVDIDGKDSVKIYKDRNEDNDCKTEDNDNIHASLFTFAFVARANIDTIDTVRGFLEKNDVTICYQKISADKLYITKEHELTVNYSKITPHKI